MQRPHMVGIVGSGYQLRTLAELREPVLNEIVLGVAKILDGPCTHLVAQHAGSRLDEVAVPALLMVGDVPGPGIAQPIPYRARTRSPS